MYLYPVGVKNQWESWSSTVDEQICDETSILDRIYYIMNYAKDNNLKIKYTFKFDDSVFVCKRCKEIEVKNWEHDVKHKICKYCLTDIELKLLRLR